MAAFPLLCQKSVLCSHCQGMLTESKFLHARDFAAPPSLADVPAWTLALTAAAHSKAPRAGFPQTQGMWPHRCRKWAACLCTGKSGTPDCQGRSGRFASKSAVQHGPRFCNKLAPSLWVGTGNSCPFSRLLQTEKTPGRGGTVLVHCPAAPVGEELRSLRWVWGRPLPGYTARNSGHP